MLSPLQCPFPDSILSVMRMSFQTCWIEWGWGGVVVLEWNWVTARGWGGSEGASWSNPVSQGRSNLVLGFGSYPLLYFTWH